MSEKNRFSIDSMTSPQFGELAASGALVVLLPVGSVEPHGPHMSLVTDTVISIGAARGAALILESTGYKPAIAPAIPYGVTECAAAFPGAVSVPGDILTAMIGAVADGYLAAGATHVCVINNHLEPAQDSAVRAVQGGRTKVSIACPLTRKWGRTLSAEFKSGACHAGQYETSIILACDPSMVDRDLCESLEAVNVSLASQLQAGVNDFLEMGLSKAYAGTPAEASAKEGHETLRALADMITGEILAVLEVND